MAEVEAETRSAQGPLMDAPSVASEQPLSSSPSVLLELIAASTAGAGDAATPSAHTASAPTASASVAVPPVAPAGVAWGSGLGVAEVLELEGAQVRVRRLGVEGVCSIPDFVDRELVAQAIRQRERVLIEPQPDGSWQVAGILQTRRPDVVRIEGREVELVGAASVTLKSGHAGLRLSADGQVEVIGSRIGVASRGLLRLVGRALRLN